MRGRSLSRVGRCACPPLHGAQAQEPVAHAPERPNKEITAAYSGMIYATTCENIESRRKAFIREWRLKHRVLGIGWKKPASAGSPSPACRRVSGRAQAPTNAIERLHEEIKRRIKTQTVLPPADTAAMLFRALLAFGQINMRKMDGWQTLATKPIDQAIDLAA